jgi:RHS repeat-associated protein
MRTVDGESYYYLYNGHADVTALIDTDGNIAATYYYDAFGNILEQTGAVDNNITYAGYQYDEETGLYYLNARMYDPKIARFLQEDTYRGDPNDPLSLNLYAYCRNNPLVYWDPTGYKWVKKYEGSTLDWYWDKEYRYEGSQLCEIPRTLDDDILGDLLRGLDKSKRGEYYQYYLEAAKNGSKGVIFGVDPVQAFNFDHDADYETLNLRYQQNAVKQIRESGTQYDLNGLDLSGLTFEQYVNIMGPIWELNHKYRTIDDEIRDAKIGAAIIGGVAAGYFGPYAANVAITNPTGIYIITHAEPIVYGTIGVVGGSFSLKKNIEEENYIGAVIDIMIIGISTMGFVDMSKDYRSYMNWMNEGTRSTISDETLKWLNKGDADNVVYYGVKDGEAVYTGITKQDLAKRLYQHNYGPKGKGLDYLEEKVSGLTRNQARAIEQYLIENGPANAMNQINSISPNSPYYNEALIWAKNFLNGLK